MKWNERNGREIGEPMAPTGAVRKKDMMTSTRRQILISVPVLLAGTLLKIETKKPQAICWGRFEQGRCNVVNVTKPFTEFFTEWDYLHSLGFEATDWGFLGYQS